MPPQPTLSSPSFHVPPSVQGTEEEERPGKRYPPLRKRLAQRVFIKARDQPFAGRSQRPLDYARFLRHQLQRLLGAHFFGVQTRRLEGGAFRIEELARIMTGEDFTQFVGRERRLGVVAFRQFNLKLGAQELPRIAARASGGTPKKSRFFHDI